MKSAQFLAQKKTKIKIKKLEPNKKKLTNLNNSLIFNILFYCMQFNYQFNFSYPCMQI